MKIETAYLKFVDLVGENSTNNNTAVDASRFIFLFNTSQNKFVEWVLNKRNEDKIRYISNLLVESELQYDSKTEVAHFFQKPEDFFDHSNLIVYASTKTCPTRKLDKVFEIKSDDVEEMLADEYNKPSFEFSETFYHYTGKGLKIYTNSEFSIDKAKLTYYRYPVQVNISGYINEFNQNSQTVHPEFDDKVVDRILQVMAKDFSSNNQDTTAYQMNLAQVFSEI